MGIKLLPSSVFPKGFNLSKSSSQFPFSASFGSVELSLSRSSFSYPMIRILQYSNQYIPAFARLVSSSGSQNRYGAITMNALGILGDGDTIQIVATITQDFVDTFFTESGYLHSLIQVPLSVSVSIDDDIEVDVQLFFKNESNVPLAVYDSKDAAMSLVPSIQTSVVTDVYYSEGIYRLCAVVEPGAEQLLDGYGGISTDIGLCHIYTSLVFAARGVRYDMQFT